MKRLSILIPLFLCACMATGTTYSDQSDPHVGTIIVYRGWSSAFESFSIDVNGKPACDLAEKGFFVVRSNNSVNISASKWSMPGTSRIAVTAKPGQVKFVQIEMSTTKRLFSAVGYVGVFAAEGVAQNAGPYNFELVDAVRAKSELVGLKEDCVSK